MNLIWAFTGGFVAGGGMIFALAAHLVRRDNAKPKPVTPNYKMAAQYGAATLRHLTAMGNENNPLAKYAQRRLSYLEEMLEPNQTGEK